MAKYCLRIHPLMKQWYSGNSHSWNAMCKIKKGMDKHILWKMEKGDIAFWFDNWTNMGTLCNFLPEDRKPRNLKLNEIPVDDHWRWGGCDAFLPSYVVEEIYKLQISLNPGKLDKPLWTADLKGTFSIASVWNISEENNKSWMDAMTWTNMIPFQMSFILWRALMSRP